MIMIMIKSNNDDDDDNDNDDKYYDKKMSVKHLANDTCNK